MKRLLSLLLPAFLFVGAVFAGEAPSWDLDALGRPPAVTPAPEVPSPEGLRSFYYEGLPYKGNPTKVFAFYGAPAGADAAHKVPAIVLVHGAGGTAFEAWVRLWVSRGYAAIAFDDEGQLPIGSSNKWTSHAEGGPRRADIADLDKPLPDQWMYHAVADTILAHSLLRSFPEVDVDRIGITGISWGGVVTSIVVGVDPRLKFAVPVYGCGFISDDVDDGSRFVGQKATLEQLSAWRTLWDPSHFLPQAKLPMLWVAGTNDFAFTLRAWQLSYRATSGPRTLSLRVRMPHAHGGPGESPEEIRAFADSVVNGGMPLAQVEPPIHEGEIVSSAYKSLSPIVSAELNYTRDGGVWQKRQWVALSAKVEGGKVSAVLPLGTTVYYFSLVDQRGLLVTSEHEVLPGAPSSVTP